MDKSWTDFILNALPFFLLVAFCIFMMRNMKTGGGSKWQKNLERQLELQEMQFQTLKETNELLRKIIANR
jgi:large-conductance mechanosensitive channel